MNIIQKLTIATCRLINLAKISFVSFFVIWSSSVAAQIVPETGWWYNSNESGRGYSIEYSAKSDAIFMALYAYEIASPNDPTWYTAYLKRTSGNVFKGELTTWVNGPALFNTQEIGNPKSSSYGTISLEVSDKRTAIIDIQGYGANAKMFEKIVRFEFVKNGLDSPPSGNQPQNGWWWDPAQNGKGYFIETQGGNSFIAGYTYLQTNATESKPFWYAVTSVFDPSVNKLLSTQFLVYKGGQSIGQPYYQPVTTTVLSAFNLSLGQNSNSAGLLTIVDNGFMYNSQIKRFDF